MQNVVNLLLICLKIKQLSLEATLTTLAIFPPVIVNLT